MHATLTLLLTLAQVPEPPAPVAPGPSAAEWAAHVDRKLLSFGMKGLTPTLRSSERTIELGQLLSLSNQLEDIFAEVPEAKATFIKAQADLRMGTFLGMGSLGCLLLGAGLVVGAVLTTSATGVVMTVTGPW